MTDLLDIQVERADAVQEAVMLLEEMRAQLVRLTPIGSPDGCIWLTSLERRVDAVSAQLTV